MSAIVQAYKRSPSGNCNATDDWKKKNRTWNWHWFMPIVVEDDIIFFHFFSWQHLKAKVCIQDQMTEGLKLIMISIACIDKEYCISTSPFLLYSWKMPLCCSIMVSALDSGWRGLGLRPSTGLAWSKHKTLYFYSASIQPGVWMDTGQLSGKSDKMLGSNLVMDQHSIQGGSCTDNTPCCFMLWKPR